MLGPSLRIKKNESSPPPPPPLAVVVLVILARPDDTSSRVRASVLLVCDNGFWWQVLPRNQPRVGDVKVDFNAHVYDVRKSIMKTMHERR